MQFGAWPKMVAYGRWSLTGGGCLREAPSIVIKLENFLYFGKVVAYERWSLTRGGRKRRFDCSSCNTVRTKNKNSHRAVEEIVVCIKRR